MNDDFSPIKVGNTAAIFSPHLRYKNLQPVPLTGCTITMKMKLVKDRGGGIPEGTIKICAGNFTIDDAVGGRAHRKFQAADVDTPGDWELELIVTNSSNEPLNADDGNGENKVLTILPIF